MTQESGEEKLLWMVGGGQRGELQEDLFELSEQWLHQRRHQLLFLLRKREKKTKINLKN